MWPRCLTIVAMWLWTLISAPSCFGFFFTAATRQPRSFCWMKVARNPPWARTLQHDAMYPLYESNRGASAMDPTSKCIDTTENENTKASTSSIRRAAVPISVALTIGCFSLAEIVESTREMTCSWATHKVGHANGMVILATIRLMRSITILYTQVDELREETEKLDLIKPTLWKQRPLRHALAAVGRFLFSPVVTVLACILAAGASVLEIWADMRPGAHHGAALLALSELSYQIRRLRHYRRSCNKIVATNTTSSKFDFPAFPDLRIGTVTALAASIFAIVEIIEDTKPGAHHAVAVLAVAEFVENVNRSRILNGF